MSRYAKLTVVCGRRGSGKTNLTLQQLYRAVKAGRKALIFDPTDEFRSYIFRPGEPPHSIKPIFIKDIPRFTASNVAEIVRIRPFLDDSTKMSTDDMQEVLIKILSVYKNGILLIEDINKYVPDNASNGLIGSMATLRQANVDLIAQYQLVGKAGNPKLLGMTNYIRLHKTEDEVIRHADKFNAKTKILSIAESIVNRRYKYGVDNKINTIEGKFFNVVVDLDDSKIKGIFTQAEAEHAITEYISDNARDTIQKLFNRRDRYGQKVWKDYTSTYAYLERSMMQDFFTFPE
jgi:RecA/RadA recombinase